MPCGGGAIRLRRTAAGDRTALPRPSRAESEKAARKGREEAPRVTLRREVSRAAAAAGSEQEFFALLAQSGVLVRTRQSARRAGEVTGYAVALAGDTARGGKPVWFGGGKLAPDLTLPKLRRRWPGTASPGVPLTAADRSAAWEQALSAVDAAAAHVRQMAAGSSDGAADAAWAAAGTLHVAAAVLGSRVLQQAADAYDRAARAPYARIPAPTLAGNSLRGAARLLSALAFLSDDPSLRPVLLITRLAALAEAVAALRESQQRAAQAASALSAAQHLRDAVGTGPVPGSGAGRVAGTAAGLAGAGFPAMPGPVPAASPAPPPRKSAPPPPGPSPRPGP